MEVVQLTQPNFLGGKKKEVITLLSHLRARPQACAFAATKSIREAILLLLICLVPESKKQPPVFTSSPVGSRLTT